MKEGFAFGRRHAQPAAVQIVDTQETCKNRVSIGFAVDTNQTSRALPVSDYGSVLPPLRARRFFAADESTKAHRRGGPSWAVIYR
jgi:hypothetical protein